MKGHQIGNNDMQTVLSSWVQAFGDALYSRALYQTSQPSVAEDLVQETFLAASQAFESFQGKSSPKTWLFSILNHKIVDYYRKQLKNPVMTESVVSHGEKGNILDILFDQHGNWKKKYRPQPWPQEQELLDDPDFVKRLRYCIKKLPAPWFAVVQLKHVEGKAGKEISQELGITPSNYWQILHRAKLQLRHCLETWMIH